ncbi:hypothetical protein ABZX65_34270 [Streptomyces sp. NPDC003300]|uniref:hypothetical protein n=1 Tax=unclassified Streptomyces TaxID=2593676 RepID=UPI0033A32ABF
MADATNDPAPTSKTAVMDVSIDGTAMTLTPDQGFLSDSGTAYPVVLDPHGVADKNILEATFNAEEVWSANCTPMEIQLWRTSSISSSTTWNKPSTWYVQVDAFAAAKGSSSGCPGGNLEFNATKATLSVTFVSAPTEPTGLRMADPNVGCADEAHPAIIRTATPRLSAAPKSSDGSQATLRPNFVVQTAAGVLAAKGTPVPCTRRRRSTATSRSTRPRPRRRPSPPPPRGGSISGARLRSVVMGSRGRVRCLIQTY